MSVQFCSTSVVTNESGWRHMRLPTRPSGVWCASLSPVIRANLPLQQHSFSSYNDTSCETARQRTLESWWDGLKRRCCCSRLDIPVVKGEVATVTVLVFRIFFPDFALTTFSINGLQLLLFFAFVLHSSPTLSRPLLTRSSHRILGLLRFLSPSTSGHLVYLPVFHIPFLLSMWTYFFF